MRKIREPRTFIDRSLIGLVVVWAILHAPMCASAASIIWGAPTGIGADTDVSTNGTLVSAFNLGSSGVPTTAVNGVTFTGLVVSGTLATSGNFSFSSSPSMISTNSLGSGAAPFVNLSSSYKTLLSSAGGGVNLPITLTISSLTVGAGYEFEWWAANSIETTQYLDTATAGSAVTLNTNPSATVGGVGQWVVGTFIADSPSEVISFNSTNGGPIINAVQLRQTSVPEPSSTLLLIAAGLAGPWNPFRRRRERK